MSFVLYFDICSDFFLSVLRVKIALSMLLKGNMVEIDGEANALISSDILFLLFGLLFFLYFKWHKADFFSH